MFRQSLVAVAFLCLTATACSSSSNDVTANESNSASHAPTESTPARTDPFGWRDVDDEGVVQTGTLTVPADYEHPDAGNFQLFMARHLADPDQRIGSLLVNPGGPGVPGSTIALNAEGFLSEDLLAHFDIVGWDPRGTGATVPAIDCVDDYDRYYAYTDITPDDDAEYQQRIDLAKEFETMCVTKNRDILQFVGTNNSARDMNTIREALGEDKISYFGFSYGSELGATWTTLFPDTVRAAVLDGALDPTVGLTEWSLQQNAGFERSLATFLAWCSGDSDCAFRNAGDAEDAFDQLMTDLDDRPIPTSTARPDLTRGVALAGVGQALYTEQLWPELAAALEDAQAGDGYGLLALYDEYYQRRPDGSYDNVLEAFQTIRCMDDADRPTVAEEDASAARVHEVAPRFSPGIAGSYFCTFFPPTNDPRIEITGAGAGPIVVVGTTGDPATPLDSSEKMAETLEDGVLVVVVGERHTGYGINQCSFDVIDGYLIDLDVPDNGVRCE